VTLISYMVRTFGRSVGIYQHFGHVYCACTERNCYF